MKKAIVLSLLLVMAGAASLFAHPPTEIQLQYDQSRDVLSVKMTHVSNNTPKHHIRRIQIFVNGEEKESVYFVNQTSGQGFQEDLSLAAQPGDKIRIKASCNVAGYGEAELEVPAEVKDEKSTKE